jgi:F420-dependent oxidoreductase-like protein
MGTTHGFSDPQLVGDPHSRCGPCRGHHGGCPYGPRMQLRIMTEPQEGATYDDVLAVAQECERLGFEAFFRSDHLQRIGDHEPGAGSPETWATLAGLARDTSSIRLGTMVTSATFRLPGMLAMTVATVDAMSGGRIELGLGAGWFEAEHKAFGVPFPPVGERFDRLEEQLAIVTGLWATSGGGTFSFRGEHYSLEGNNGLPKPVQEPRPPVIIGGTGRRRTPQLAARFADEYNVPPFSALDVAAEAIGRTRAACDEAGRDPESLVYPATQTLIVGSSEREVRRRAAAVGSDADELRDTALVGAVPEVVDRLGRFGELGATRMYLQLLDIHDLEQLQLVAEEILPVAMGRHVA